MTDKIFSWKWIVSPTLFLSDTFKRNAHNPKMRGLRIIFLNKTYLGISIGLALLIWISQYREYPPFLIRCILIISPIFSFSRCNEIFFAFIKDAFDKLNPAYRKTNGLHYYQRVQLALRSYTELIIHYGILFYLFDTFYKVYHLSTPIFNQSIETLFHALYFSLITVVAIGYGEFYPIHDIGRFLVMYEVITGTLLIVVSFTVYVNLNFKE